MKKVDVQAGSPSHNASQGMCSVARRYLRTEWPSAVLVAAVVFIIHHEFHWLDAVDGHAFMAIGHSAFVAEPRRSEQVVALLIDAETHETRYRERSPLSRCELHKDLKRLYDARPDLVAIDIDISPAIWTWNPPELPFAASAGRHADSPKETLLQTEIDCEEQLYRMIESRKESQKTTTVIMTPFKVSERAADLQQQKLRWQTRMEKAGVRFGDAQLPVTYGLVIEQYPNPGSFAAQARAVTPRTKRAPQGRGAPSNSNPRSLPIAVAAL